MSLLDFFTPKCDICGLPETPSARLYSDGVAMQAHQRCWIMSETLTSEYTVVAARVEYIVEVSRWDYQNNCTDGTIKYGIFPTQKQAEQWFIDKGYVTFGDSWSLDKERGTTGRVKRRIVELDSKGYNV